MSASNTNEKAGIPSSTIAVPESLGLDSSHLARLGKSQVLRRNFGFIAVVGFSCTVMISWEAALFNFSIGFSASGYTGSFVGYIVVWLGTLSSIMTMAELASMAPTAAGQYHWVSMLSPPSSRKFLSYVIGWLTVTGWFAATASVCYLCAQILQGLAAMTHPEYTPTMWQIPLIYWLVLIFAVVFNTVAVKILPRVEALTLVLHIVGFFAIFIPIVVCGSKTDASVVFSTWLNSGDWPTQGLSFLIGLVGPAFGLLGGDAAVHMSEEVIRPAVNVPRAMYVSVLINGVLGTAMIVVQLFYLGDATSVLGTSLGFPFIALFQQAVSSNAGAATMVAIVWILLMCCCISIIATASRLVWAFARDRGLPGWQLWSKVDKRTHVPLLSVGLVVIVVVILSVIAFGSSLAFNDVVSLTVANLFFSYLIGNSLLLYKRLAGDIEAYNPNETEIVNTIGASRLTWGPWKIPGILGIVNNIIGCAFLLVVMVFSFFPVGIEPTPATMNWSCFMFGAIAIIALVYYAVCGRRVYHGPVIEDVRGGKVLGTIEP